MSLPEIPFSIVDVDPIEDPRSSGMLNERPAALGESIVPDEERYPGWELTPILTDDTTTEHWLFALAPNRFTGPGLIEAPEDMPEKEKITIEERPLQGKGHVLIQLPTGLIRIEQFDSQNPRLVSYGEGAIVAYVADNEGLVGLNSGKPPGVKEPILDIQDKRINDDFREMYLRFTRM
jgi:hypothetical protein